MTCIKTECSDAVQACTRDDTRTPRARAMSKRLYTRLHYSRLRLHRREMTKNPSVASVTFATERRDCLYTFPRAVLCSRCRARARVLHVTIHKSKIIACLWRDSHTKFHDAAFRMHFRPIRMRAIVRGDTHAHTGVNLLSQTTDMFTMWIATV